MKPIISHAFALYVLLLIGCGTPGAPNQLSGSPLPPNAAALPYLHAVVRLSGGVTCTGTLVTPRLVITAAHCFGFDSNNPADRGLRGGEDKNCVVEDSEGRIIARNGCGTVYFTHLNQTLQNSVSAEIRHVWVVRGMGSAGKPNGLDIAIVSLHSRATPKTAAAAPSVPVWFEGDPGANYWKTAEIVYAGWGLTDFIADTCEGINTASRPATRLAAEWRKRLDGEFPVDSQSVDGSLITPMFIANFALYGDSTGLTLKGDSGGPLFSPDRAGTMSLIGLTSGTACRDSEFSGTLQSLWVRTFNVENAALIRRILVASNGRLRGADVSVSDSDGDGVADAPPPDANQWIGEVDNCPDVANPDQQDSDFDGIGDACSTCPKGICTPPPAAPKNCRIGPHGASCGFANIQCDAPLPAADIKVVDETNKSTLAKISQDSKTGRIDVAYMSGGNVQLTVCASDRWNPPSCSNRFQAAFGPSTCNRGAPPGFRCPTGQVLCQGGFCKPISECKFPK